ncbi:hypothetical protein DL96DRAFT_1629386 [Flagelloscypha sp. PMI_526]|nr:hypothetical protein DL96DRAFT_1629386 [Flagelloscypha sp. PMI_526]
MSLPLPSPLMALALCLAQTTALCGSGMSRPESNLRSSTVIRIMSLPFRSPLVALTLSLLPMTGQFGSGMRLPPISVRTSRITPIPLPLLRRIPWTLNCCVPRPQTLSLIGRLTAMVGLFSFQP